ncbi:hypothetical protein KXW98_004536 [Aspergillus fumigatus]|nr:hypothetical protein CNMCM8714_007510 [Aspergillus fumigatus]KMK62885.1 DASH complex subunit DAD1 [Aspergillus fumigatus Z5]KAF4268779.1 hypothetical protein CNMCM8057_008436 [Aspergillus fumigatus]KAF4269415.1 hypothetical protein CNMCM8812_001536 [Aspergillus fumigatus]KAF4281688.1 hypothetical protein CNMCM8689_000399 [Aspergillus fumigatus]
MSTTPRRSTPTVFEQQRAELVREIAVGMEQVLQNINRLNRNLESIIAVGNEFSSVEALWSQFENFMDRSEDNEQKGTRQGEGQHDGEEGRDGHDQSFNEGESRSH